MRAYQTNDFFRAHTSYDNSLPPQPSCSRHTYTSRVVSRSRSLRPLTYLIVIVICFDFGGLFGLYVDLYSCLRFVLNEKTRQYSTATNTIYIRAFHLPNGCNTIEEEEEEHEFIRLHISKYTMVVIVVNEQCNTGDPLETSGGLYRAPPSMIIYINSIKCCACETLDLVQISITMNVKLLQ